MKNELPHNPELASAQFAALLKRFDDNIPRRTHFNALFDALVFGRSSIRQIAKPPSVGKNVPVCDTPDDAYRAYGLIKKTGGVISHKNFTVMKSVYEIIADNEPLSNRIFPKRSDKQRRPQIEVTGSRLWRHSEAHLTTDSLLRVAYESMGPDFETWIDTFYSRRPMGNESAIVAKQALELIRKTVGAVELETMTFTYQNAYVEPDDRENNGANVTIGADRIASLRIVVLVHDDVLVQWGHATGPYQNTFTAFKTLRSPTSVNVERILASGDFFQKLS